MTCVVDKSSPIELDTDNDLERATGGTPGTVGVGVGVGREEGSNCDDCASSAERGL